EAIVTGIFPWNAPTLGDDSSDDTDQKYQSKEHVNPDDSSRASGAISQCPRARSARLQPAGRSTAASRLHPALVGRQAVTAEDSPRGRRSGHPSDEPPCTSAAAKLPPSPVGAGRRDAPRWLQGFLGVKDR